MLLLLLVAIPLLFALAVVIMPAERTRLVATIGTLVPIGLYAFIASEFFWLKEVTQFRQAVSWIPALGIELSVGVDAVSMLLLALTVLLGPICVICSFSAISERPKTYYGWLLVLQAAMTGVFCAQDLIFFYICFEFTLVPLYILINLYGSDRQRRKVAATKFFLYTFTGSLMTLAGLVYIVWAHANRLGEWSFDITALLGTARTLSPTEQAWCFWAMMLGFGVKVPIFPVHTWLPLAHTEAPTAGSVILAGVLLKLGTYGIFRFAIPFAPDAAVRFAPVIGVLAVIGIVYAGLICWIQRDVKKLVAYSSVSHLGFCVLGLFAMTSIGITGSILYMINHGLSTGALFLLIGMVYERYHTRNMDELGGLASKMPIWATFMVFFTMASVGLPGLNGFISEFMCLLGTFQGWTQWSGATGESAGAIGPLGPWFAVFGALGVVVTAMYLLYMLGRVVFGELREPSSHEDGHGPLPTDLNLREIGVLTPLAILCLVLGLYPTPVLRVLEGPSQTMAEMLSERVEVAAASNDGAGHETGTDDAGHAGDDHNDHDHDETGGHGGGSH